MRQPMPLGFSTLGLSEHSLGDSVRMIAACGYDAIGLRLNPRDLSPASSKGLIKRVASLVSQAPDRRWILETDGKYLLDPKSAFGPTLMEADQSAIENRQRVILAAIRAMAPVGGIVTLSSGPVPIEISEEIALERLAASLRRLQHQAHRLGVLLALRPAIGSLVSRMAHYERLMQWLPDAPISLAADIPTMVRGGELPIGSLIARYADRLCCVFAADLLETDARDFAPGEGHMHWPAIFSGLKACWFGPLCVRYVGCDPAKPAHIFEALDSLRRETR